MKSFLNYLVAATVFFGAASAQIASRACQIKAPDGKSFVVGSRPSNIVTVSEVSDANSWWLMPKDGAVGPITHSSSFRKTIIGTGGQVLAEVNAESGENWVILNDRDKIIIKATSQNNYWTVKDNTIWVMENPQIFTLSNCAEFA